MTHTKLKATTPQTPALTPTTTTTKNTTNQPKVVLFLTTGRCGTQWVASRLAAHYPDQAVVTHEPLGPIYNPLKYFRNQGEVSEPAVLQHIQNINNVISENKMYIEVGWPIFGILPAIIKKLGPQNVKIVHYIRNPVDTALSLVSGGWYCDNEKRSPLFKMYRAELDPFTDNVQDKDYFCDKWEEMSAYEKCLFWWNCVAGYINEIIEQFPECEVYKAQYESLVLRAEPTAMENLLKFLNLPYKPDMVKDTDIRVDTWHKVYRKSDENSTSQSLNQSTTITTTISHQQATTLLLKYKPILNTATQLGYNIETTTTQPTNIRTMRKQCQPLNITQNSKKMYDSVVYYGYLLPTIVSMVGYTVLISLLLFGITTCIMVSASHFSTDLTPLLSGIIAYTILMGMFGSRLVFAPEKVPGLNWTIPIQKILGIWIFTEIQAKFLSCSGCTSQVVHFASIASLLPLFVIMMSVWMLIGYYVFFSARELYAQYSGKLIIKRA